MVPLVGQNDLLTLNFRKMLGCNCEIDNVILGGVETQCVAVLWLEREIFPVYRERQVELGHGRDRWTSPSRRRIEVAHRVSHVVA